MATGVVKINGERVRELREAQLMGVRELGREAGVTHETVMEIERGERTRVYRQTIRKLAEALGVEPRALLKDVGTASDSDGG